MMKNWYEYLKKKETSTKST